MRKAGTDNGCGSVVVEDFHWNPHSRTFWGVSQRLMRCLRLLQHLQHRHRRENEPPQLMVWDVITAATQMASPPFQNFRSTPEGWCLWNLLTGPIELRVISKWLQLNSSEHKHISMMWRPSISPHLPKYKVTPPFLLPATSRNNHLCWVWQFSCKCFCFCFHFREFCTICISHLCDWRHKLENSWDRFLNCLNISIAVLRTFWRDTLSFVMLTVHQWSAGRKLEPDQRNPMSGSICGAFNCVSVQHYFVNPQNTIIIMKLFIITGSGPEMSTFCRVPSLPK